MQTKGMSIVHGVTVLGLVFFFIAVFGSLIYMGQNTPPVYFQMTGSKVQIIPNLGSDLTAITLQVAWTNPEKVNEFPIGYRASVLVNTKALADVKDLSYLKLNCVTKKYQTTCTIPPQ